MEYYLCRAMETSRLTEEQLIQLQSHEKKERVVRDYDPQTNTFKFFETRMRRALFPLEIQECLDLCPLKDHYTIPHDDSSQSMHNQRLRVTLKDLKLIPKKGDFGVSDVDDIHAFDWKVREAADECKISFHFQVQNERRKRIKESLSEVKNSSQSEGEEVFR